MELNMAKYDLILSGGTVLDPANGFEDVADVGVKAGMIARVAPELDPFDGEEIIDVSGPVGDAWSD